MSTGAFVSALAEAMTAKRLQPETLETEEAYVAMRAIGYDGVIVLHAKSGVPQEIEITIKKAWKLI